VSDAGLGRTTPDRRGGDLKLPACRSPLRSRAYSSDSDSSRVRRAADTPPKQSERRRREGALRGERRLLWRLEGKGKLYAAGDQPTSVRASHVYARGRLRGVRSGPAPPYIGRTHLDVTGSEGLVASVIAYSRAARAPAKRTVAFAWA